MINFEGDLDVDWMLLDGDGGQFRGRAWMRDGDDGFEEELDEGIGNMDQRGPASRNKGGRPRKKQ
ncbi:hypothetical protein HDU93_006805, partial [Gonapodya sp. JEL0774]